MSSIASVAQEPCGFDPYYDEFGPSFIDQVISDMINPSGSMYQAITSNETYTIPVVVHIIYINNEFHPSHISQQKVIDGINLLNDDMRQLGAGMGTGEDVNIEFCLAQRDPSGNPTNGIIYYDGTNICLPNGSFCYASDGFSSINEAYLKENKVWPQDDYLNIWVVHKIANGASGIARYPGQMEPLFGPIVLYNKMGISGDNRILTHEVGHSFGLRHTFEEDINGTACPPASNTSSDGDLCADTDPHIRSNQDCILSEANQCVTGSTLELLKRNYMNYSELACMNRFTADQRMRMRASLMGPLNGLMHSLGCATPCPDVETAMAPDVIPSIEQDETVLFESESVSNLGLSLTNTWHLNGQEVATTNQANIHFTQKGMNRVCLRSSNGTCANQTCIDVFVFRGVPCIPEQESCQNLLLNGSFDNNTPEQPPVGPNFHELCNWTGAISFPRSCAIDPQDTDFVMAQINFDAGNAITGSVTTNPIEFVENRLYSLSFDYQCTGIPDCGFLIALVPFWDYERGPITDPIPLLPNGSQIIHQTINIPTAGPRDPQGPCTPPNVAYGYLPYQAIEFEVEMAGEYFILVSALNTERPVGSVGNDNNNFIINNMVLSGCCELSPSIEVEPIDECTYRFVGSNLGDETSFIWSIEGGPQSISGEVIDYTFALQGEYEVCLTVICDDFSDDEQICTTVTIEPECNNCSDAVTINGQALSCPGSNTYQANVSLFVDPGFAPCRFNDVDVYGDHVNYSDHSYNQATSTLDLVLEFDNTPSGTYQVVLCGPKNETRCFIIAIESTTECENCQTLNITAEAVCIDPDPTDNIQVYEGSINIPIPPGATVVPCGGTASIAGFTTEPGSISGSTYFVPFKISTSDNQSLTGSGTICLEIDNVLNCFFFNVLTPNPCPLVTPNCAFAASYTLTCESENNRASTYIFDHILFVDNLFNQGFELCDVDGITTSYGDHTLLNSGVTRSGQGFYTKIVFEIDCEDVALQQPLELTFNFWHPNGEEFCIDFLINFDCSDCALNRGMFGSEAKEGLLVYPNPTYSFLQLEWYSSLDEASTIEIISLSGHSLFEISHVGSKASINIQNYPAGVYLVTISMGHKRLYKKVVKL